jgi:hypothetical protein
VLFARYNKNDQVMEDEMGRDVTYTGDKRNAYGFSWENQKERDH